MSCEFGHVKDCLLRSSNVAVFELLQKVKELMLS